MGIVQGRGMDTELNEKGRAQAEAFYQAYKDVPFDKIYTSTLKRTHQTVQNFNFFILYLYQIVQKMIQVIYLLY